MEYNQSYLQIILEGFSEVLYSEYNTFHEIYKLCTGELLLLAFLAFWFQIVSVTESHDCILCFLGLLLGSTTDHASRWNKNFFSHIQMLELRNQGVSRAIFSLSGILPFPLLVSGSDQSLVSLGFQLHPSLASQESICVCQASWCPCLARWRYQE